MSTHINPSQRQPDGRLIKHPMTAVCVGTALLIHGLLVDVIAADVFHTLPAGLFCLAVGLVLSFLVWRRNHRNGFVFGTALTRPLTYLILPPVIGLMVWMVLTKSIPWAAAILFCSPHAESHQFTLETYGGKGCQFRAEAVQDIRLFPGYLCVNADYVRRHGHRVVLIRLIGDRTPLGFRIRRFEHQDVIGPARSDRWPR